MKNSTKNCNCIILTLFIILMAAGSLLSQIDENTPALDMFLGGDVGIKQDELESIVRDTSGGLRGPGVKATQTRITYTVENEIRRTDSIMLKNALDSLKFLLNRDDNFIAGQKYISFKFSRKFRHGDSRRVVLFDTSNTDTSLLRYTRNVFKSKRLNGKTLYNKKIKLRVIKAAAP